MAVSDAEAVLRLILDSEDASEDLKAFAKGAVDTLDEVGDAGTKAGDGLGEAGSKADDLSDLFGRLDSAGKRIEGTLASQGKAATKSGLSFQGLAVRIGIAVGAILAVKKVGDELNSVLSLNAEANEKWEKRVAGVNEALKKLGGFDFGFLEDVRQWFSGNAKAATDFEKAILEAAAGLQIFKDAQKFSGFTPEDLAAQNAAIRGLVERLSQYSGAISETSQKFKINTKDAQALRDALKDSGRPIPDLIQLWAEYGDSLDEAHEKTDRITKGFKSMAQQIFGNMEALEEQQFQLEKLFESLKEAPDAVSGKIWERIGEAAKELIEDFEELGEVAPDSLKLIARQALRGADALEELDERVKSIAKSVKEAADEAAAVQQQAFPVDGPTLSQTQGYRDQAKQVGDLRQELEKLRSSATLTEEQSLRQLDITRELTKLKADEAEQWEVTEETALRAAKAEVEAGELVTKTLQTAKDTVKDLKEEYGALGLASLNTLDFIVDGWESTANLVGAAELNVTEFGVTFNKALDDFKKQASNLEDFNDELVVTDGLFSNIKDNLGERGAVKGLEEFLSKTSLEQSNKQLVEMDKISDRLVSKWAQMGALAEQFRGTL